jgi:hypothetical protein
MVISNMISMTDMLDTAKAINMPDIPKIATAGRCSECEILHWVYTHVQI